MVTKNAYYFSHDSNARTDPKILALINDFGMEGYGRYWVIVEMLSEQKDYELSLSDWVFSALAMQWQCERNAAKDFVYACVSDYELLASDGEVFWSNSLKKRMGFRDERRRKRSEAAKKAAAVRWGNDENVSDGNADAMQTQCDSMRMDAKESKVKESKGKKRKENSIATNKFDGESIPYRLALHLKNVILEKDSNTRVPKNLNSWATEADRMIRLDNRNPQEAANLMTWAQNDPFWCANILSMSKFRKQYDTLLRQAVRTSQTKSKQESDIDRMLREAGVTNDKRSSLDID